MDCCTPEATEGCSVEAMKIILLVTWIFGRQ